MRPEKLNFIRLGTRTRPFVKLGVGNKAALLNEAVKAGLPVPNGIVLLDNAWRRLIDEGIVSVEGPDVTVHSADDFLERFALHEMQRPVAVRSAFAAEDRPHAALAGYFLSRLNVPHDDPDALIEALVEVWQSADRQPGPFRRDILVMEMAAAQTAGVAFTQAAYEDDLVNFTAGVGDRLLAGQVGGEALTLPKLRAWERPTAVEPWQRRLQMLLRGVRRSFNLRGTDWDVEWADDGQVCWLLQVRPITAPPRRNELFTFANLKEILPDPPSPFMTGIVTEASSQFFDWYRQFDSRLPADRPLVELFYGRPLFNLSLLEEMLRLWGLPTALVSNSIGGGSAHNVGFKLARFLRSTVPLLRLGWQQLNAPRLARRHAPRLLAQAAQAGDSFTAVSAAFRDLFAAFVTEMFNLTQAMSGPLLVLRRAGALQQAAEPSTVTTEMYAAFRRLQELAAAHPAWQSDLAAGRPPVDPAFAQAWAAFLERYGRRGVYESDIARPRYREQPELLLQALARPPAPLPAERPAGRRPLWTRPFWRQLQRVQAAREEWRHEAMACYELTRARLLALAAAAVARGQLPHSAALWQLSPTEVRALDAGEVYDTAFFAARTAEQERLAQLALPDLLARFDDLESAEVAADGDAPTTLHGLGLTAGEAEGVAWVLHEPTSALPAGFTPHNTVLVARSIDAGWMATFSQAAAVVVEIGGDLSHGSILLREIGLPAVTNVAGATRHIHTGERLRVRAAQGAVQRLAATAEGEPAG